jgi:hypothetical protein
MGPMESKSSSKTIESWTLAAVVVSVKFCNSMIR